MNVNILDSRIHPDRLEHNKLLPERNSGSKKADDDFYPTKLQFLLLISFIIVLGIHAELVRANAAISVYCELPGKSGCKSSPTIKAFAPNLFTMNSDSGMPAGKIRLRSLLLTGGRSKRMGSPKHLLPFPHKGRESTLLEKLLNAHRTLATRVVLPANVLWELPTYVSVCDPKQSADMVDILDEIAQVKGTQVIIDTKLDAGPASGLITAHCLDPSAHYLVTGCDYPMLTADALLYLLNSHITEKPAVTCFVNKEGWTEPLLAIWSPWALSALHQTSLSSDASVGPNRILRLLAGSAITECSEPREPFSVGVLKVKPLDSSWIVNVNTPEEYERVRRTVDRDPGNSIDP